MTDKEFQQFMIKHITELANDVKDLRQNTVRLETKFTEKIDILFDGYQSISEKLNEHTAILNKHSATLDEHTAILNKHSATLDEHGKLLQRIEDKLETHDIQIHILDKTKSNKRKVK